MHWVLETGGGEDEQSEQVNWQLCHNRAEQTAKGAFLLSRPPQKKKKKKKKTKLRPWQRGSREERQQRGGMEGWLKDKTGLRRGEEREKEKGRGGGRRGVLVSGDNGGQEREGV